MGNHGFHKSKSVGYFFMIHMPCIMMFFTLVFFCPLLLEARKFTYKGIVYEVNDWYEEATCVTARDCCDYASEYTADGNIVIPEVVHDENDIKYTVTAIGYYSFGGAGNRLKSISIPNTINVIEDCALFGCSSLESLRLPDGLTKIKMQAFMHCHGLKSIDFPQGLESIGMNAFQYCESLESLDIPDSVTSIGSEAFRGCASLKSVKLPKGLTYIHNGVFAECSSLETVVFPESLKKVCGWYSPYRTSADLPVPGAFYRCAGLQHLKFPDSLEELGLGAFEGCSGVKTVVLSKNLKEMGDYALDCPSLEEVVYPVTDPRALPQYVYYDEYLDPYKENPLDYGGYGFLDATYDTAVLKVGTGALEKARTTAPWKFFKNIVEVDFSGVDGMTSDTSNSESRVVYRMDGSLAGDSTDGLPSGLYIVREGGKSSKVMIP